MTLWSQDTSSIPIKKKVNAKSKNINMVRGLTCLLFCPFTKDKINRIQLRIRKINDPHSIIESSCEPALKAEGVTRNITKKTSETISMVITDHRSKVHPFF